MDVIISIEKNHFGFSKAAYAQHNLGSSCGFELCLPTGLREFGQKKSTRQNQR
jgi:hypothetical protein